MKVRVIRADELSADLRCAWSAMQRARPSLDSPYFTPEYVEAAATCRPRVRIGVIEDGGRPIGFFPFEAGAFGVGGPVGGRLSDFQGIVAAIGVDLEPRQVLAGCGLRMWKFDHLLLCEHPGFARHLEATAGSPALDLHGGFEHYHARQRSTRRCIDRVLHKARKMRRQQGDARFEFDSRDPRVLEQVIRWKREQCCRTGVTDFLGKRENVALIHAISATRTSGFAGVLSVLRVGDRIAAAHFGMRSHYTLHYWFPAFDRELGRYSPGLILLLELVRAAAGAGLTRLDLGKGDDRYKRDFCTHEIPVGAGAVSVSPLLTRLRRWQAAGVHFLRTAPLAASVRVPVQILRRHLRQRRSDLLAGTDEVSGP